MLTDLAARHPDQLPVLSLLARTLADQGRHVDALVWCNRWISADKLDVGAHYLRATILFEQADLDRACQSFQRAVFLEPDFVLAHFALGNVARRRGKPSEAGRHFANAQLLLADLPQTDILPESDGLTVGRLSETIAATTSSDTAP